MRTREIKARRLSVSHQLVEQEVGPRGGEGPRVGRKICEVQVSGDSVTLRVRVGTELETRPFKASDPVRIVVP